MTEYNGAAYRYRGSLPPTFVPRLESFSSLVLKRFPNEVPHILEVGAGSGTLSKKLDEFGKFKITAIDASPHSLSELTPPQSNMNLLRENVFSVNLKEPIHAIVSKDFLVAIRNLEGFLQHITPVIVHGALFMLTVFADEPGLSVAFSGEYGKKWGLVSSQSWTPDSSEVDRDWYHHIIAPRRKILTCQYSGS